MTDICKTCGCDKSLTSDKDCPICPFEKQTDDILKRTINMRSVVVTTGADPEFSGRSRVSISGDNHEMKELLDELLAI